MFTSSRIVTLITTLLVTVLIAPSFVFPHADAYGGEHVRYTGGLIFGGCGDYQEKPASASMIPLQLSGLNPTQDYTIEMSILSKKTGQRYLFVQHTQKPGRANFTFWLVTFGNEKKLHIGKKDSLVLELFVREGSSGLYLAGGAGELDCQTGMLSGDLFS